MSWVETVPVALACAVLLLLPGLLISYPLGLRGLAAWGWAPALSVFVIATTAVVAGEAGVDWSVPLVAGVSIVLAVLIGLGALLLRHRFAVVGQVDPLSVRLAGFIGIVPAILIGAIAVVAGMRGPDTLNQTFDAIFHYNAVAQILDTHNASSLVLGGLSYPLTRGSFYPGGWHDVTSLVVLATGTPIPVAANVVGAVIVLLMWPLACVLLVRQVVGRSTAALAVTGVVSIGFSAFPWGLLGFGVLWPNSLGMALVPVLLAAVASIAGIATDDVIGRSRAWVLVALGLIASGWAHPNSVFSFGALAFFAVGAGLLVWGNRMRKEGRLSRAVLWIAVFLVGCFAAWWFVAHAAAFKAVREFYWAPIETPSRAVGEALLNAPNGKRTLWLLSLIVLFGIYLCKRLPNLRWVVAGHVGSAFLFVLAASVNTPGTQKFTGYWYNDSYRLASMLPITAVPLAVVALVYSAKWLRNNYSALPERLRLPKPGWLTSVFGLTVVLGLVLVVATQGMYTDAHREVLAAAYPDPGKGNAGLLVDSAEHQFLTKIKDEIPQDSVVAENPWDGSVMLWTLADRRVLFGHIDVPWSTEQQYLAKYLVNLGTDPVACKDVKQLHVTHLLIGDGEFWKGDDRRAVYPGIVDPRGRPGFQLVDSAGALKLYKITSCTG